MLRLAAVGQSDCAVDGALRGDTHGETLHLGAALGFGNAVDQLARHFGLVQPFGEQSCGVEMIGVVKARQALHQRIRLAPPVLRQQEAAEFVTDPRVLRMLQHRALEQAFGHGAIACGPRRQRFLPRRIYFQLARQIRGDSRHGQCLPRGARRLGIAVLCFINIGKKAIGNRFVALS